jgi:hypothetical protein
MLESFMPSPSGTCVDARQMPPRSRGRYGVASRLKCLPGLAVQIVSPGDTVTAGTSRAAQDAAECSGPALESINPADVPRTDGPAIEVDLTLQRPRGAKHLRTHARPFRGHGPRRCSRGGYCPFIFGRRPVAAAIAESPLRGSGNGHRYQAVVDDGTGCRR